MSAFYQTYIRWIQLVSFFSSCVLYFTTYTHKTKQHKATIYSQWNVFFVETYIDISSYSVGYFHGYFLALGRDGSSMFVDLWPPRPLAFLLSDWSDWCGADRAAAPLGGCGADRARAREKGQLTVDFWHGGRKQNLIEPEYHRKFEFLPTSEFLAQLVSNHLGMDRWRWYHQSTFCFASASFLDNRRVQSMCPIHDESERHAC